MVMTCEEYRMQDAERSEREAIETAPLKVAVNESPVSDEGLAEDPAREEGGGQSKTCAQRGHQQ